jgi:hypothetical protein
MASPHSRFTVPDQAVGSAAGAEGVRARAFLVVFALLSVSLFLPSRATADTALACGDVVTADTVLAGDLVCSGNAIVVSGAVLDLNGHSISGDGTGRGVVVELGGLIRNGTVRGFSTGAVISGGTIMHLSLVNNARDGVDFFFNPFQFPPETIMDSVIAHNGGCGVFNISEIGTSVINSQINGNGACGIFAAGQADGGRYEGNFVANNGGDGIEIDTSTSVVIDNRVQHNSGTGISLLDEDGLSFGPGYLIAGNSSDSNGAIGISACIVDPPFTGNPCVAGMIDGGGNSARHNGDGSAAEQCVNITCAYNRGLAH